MTGGQTGGGIDGDLEYYNAERRGWNGLKPMSTPRTQLQAAALDGRLYAVGGNEGSVPKSVATTEAYEPGVDAWHPMHDMSVARSGFAAAVRDGRLYVFGGENKDGTVDSIEAFDPGRGTWSTLGLKMADPRHGLAAVAWKDRIYVLGGGRRSGLSVTDLNSVLVFGQTPASTGK
jgi:N-acetylneuraminic acid mutarotase